MNCSVFLNNCALICHFTSHLKPVNLDRMFSHGKYYKGNFYITLTKQSCAGPVGRYIRNIQTPLCTCFLKG